MHGVPVFDSVAEAVAATRANTSVIYVPAPFAADAIIEAADAGIALIVCITEGIPVRDTLGAYHHVAAHARRDIRRAGRGWSGRTARASSARDCPRSASCRATSARPARSAWCRAAARSPTRWCTS